MNGRKGFELSQIAKEKDCFFLQQTFHSKKIVEEIVSLEQLFQISIRINPF